jgi:RHH-type proline utilization regulon transcriptional repressor/proline dehydrogenase/delta 1-pyrroline-5-carboxylate dehydrogenase
MKKPIFLPGPTGESNQLHLENRGVILCFADKEVSFHFWIIALISALGTGNTVITIISDDFYEQGKYFVEPLIQIASKNAILQVAKCCHSKTLLNHPKLSGVLVDKKYSLISEINHLLSKRDGIIIPIITSKYDDELLKGLLTEKTISIDTTASGGNTSLMTLVEND